MSSSDHIISFDTALSQPYAIWSDILGVCHLLNAAHLLVNEDDFRDAGLSRKQARIKDPVAYPPDESSQFSTLAKMHQRETDLYRALLSAIIKHLKIVLPDVYSECIAACGGLQHLHKLTLPAISTRLIAEVAVTKDSRQVELLAALTDEGLQLGDTAPIRALQGRMLQLTSELTDTGYNLPDADYLRRV